MARGLAWNVPNSTHFDEQKQKIQALADPSA